MDAARAHVEAAKTVTVESPAFRGGEAIPRKYTCQGEDVSPALNLSDVPDDARALAILMEDPDAPRGTFTHWVAWNIPPDVGTLPEAADLDDMQAGEGRNDFGEKGYRGPCPPSGSHRYFIRVFALRRTLDLPGGSERRALERAMEGNILAWGEIMGTYEKSE